MIKKDIYKVKIKLTNEMLGTNPIGLDVMDKHIIDKQRKLIAEKSSINKDINKYLDAKQISSEDKEQELTSLRNRIEQTSGMKLSDEQFELLKEGNYKDLKSLFETFEELKEKGITVFFRDQDGSPTIGSHMIHGFMKNAGSIISKMNKRKVGTFLGTAAYTTSTINERVSISPKFIKASVDVNRKADGEISYLQRSLRAMTAQGPRISLAKSEVLDEGCEFEFYLKILNGESNVVEKEQLESIFDYGTEKGLGQWRNSGKGQFEVVSFELQQ